MTMFPRTVGSAASNQILPNVQVVDVAEGKIARYRKSLFPRYRLNRAWTKLSPSEAKEIDDHIIAMAGAATSFLFKDWMGGVWVDVSVGSGDGVTTEFLLPAADITSATYYDGATPLTISSTSIDGVTGQVTATFSAAPSGRIWMKGTFTRIWSVRFESDDQPLTVSLDDGYYGFSTAMITEK